MRLFQQIFNTLLYKYTVDQQSGVKNIFFHLDCWVLGNNLKSRGSASKDGRTSQARRVKVKSSFSLQHVLTLNFETKDSLKPVTERNNDYDYGPRICSLIFLSNNLPGSMSVAEQPRTNSFPKPTTINWLRFMLS